MRYITIVRWRLVAHQRLKEREKALGVAANIEEIVNFGRTYERFYYRCRISIRLTH
jgi:hypothetical protein